MSSSSNYYGLLADVTVTVHIAFVLYVVLGQLMILAGWMNRWNWVRNSVFRLTHLAAIGFVVSEVWLGIACPLTTLENHFRELAGSATYQQSFVGYWLNKILFYNFPESAFVIIYSTFFLLVLVTFIAYPPTLRRTS